MSLYVQFSNAKNLIKLQENLTPYLTISDAEFYNNYFNIASCNTQGLDNWGRILNISRSIQINTATNGVFGFGLQEDYPIGEDGYPQNFNNGYFYNPIYEPDGKNVVALNDGQYRILLLFRYKTITTNLSLYSINKIINEFVHDIAQFQGQMNAVYKARVTQTGFMKLTYDFNFNPEPWIISVLHNRDTIPVPAGVKFTIHTGVVI